MAPMTLVNHLQGADNDVFRSNVADPPDPYVRIQIAKSDPDLMLRFYRKLSSEIL